MGRPERPLNPAADPLQAFAAELRQMRRAAGSPTYKAMSLQTSTSTSALAEAAGGRSVPSWGTVSAYLRACDVAPGEWRERWVTVRQASKFKDEERVMPHPANDAVASSSDSSGASQENRIRVAIVDQHQLLLDGICAWINQLAPDLNAVVAVNTWSEMLEHPEFPVDVVLLEVFLDDEVPVASKVATLETWAIPAVFMSARPVDMDALLKDGAAGFIAKFESAEEIARLLRGAVAGTSFETRTSAAGRTKIRPHLSPQERRALSLYSSGLPLRIVAGKMGVSYNTANSYLQRVRLKYAIVDRQAVTKVDLYRRAIEDGYIISPTDENASTAT